MGKEIGIDFGTTNTVISYVNKNGRIRPLRYDKSEIIPSVIYFRNPDEKTFGTKPCCRYGKFQNVDR